MADQPIGYLIRQFENRVEARPFPSPGTGHRGVLGAACSQRVARVSTLERSMARRLHGWVGRLHGEWQTLLEQVTDEDLQSAQRTRWPFQKRPFGDVVAWVNVELAKNAAEIGYARFLYAVSAN